MNTFLSLLSRTTLAFCLLTSTVYGMEAPHQDTPEDARPTKRVLEEGEELFANNADDSQVENLKLQPDWCGDMESLTCLPHLTQLWIHQSNSVSNTVLNRLSTLQDLTILGNCGIHESLPSLTNLTSLRVHTSRDMDHNVPFGLTHITTLEMVMCNISPEGLGRLPNLTKLTLLHSANILDKTPLFMTTLKELHVQGMANLSFEELVDFVNLKSLSLKYVVKDCSAISSLTQLTALNMASHLNSSALSCLTNLTCLSCSNSFHTQGISGLTKLRKLVFENGILSLNTLSSCPLLVDLTLTNTTVKQAQANVWVAPRRELEKKVWESLMFPYLALKDFLPQ